jgi:hypothetical protein
MIDFIFFFPWCPDVEIIYSYFYRTNISWGFSRFRVEGGGGTRDGGWGGTVLCFREGGDGDDV